MHRSKEGAPASGTLGELGGRGLHDAYALGRVAFGLKTATDALGEIAVQKAEQERIRHSSQVETERIHMVRDVLLQYLDRSFDERRASFDALFTQLDAAMAQGSPDVVAMMLDGVVKLSRSSPFKDLVDIARAKEALQDKSRAYSSDVERSTERPQVGAAIDIPVRPEVRAGQGS